MPLDHQHTAQELERIARTLSNMAINLGTAGALKTSAYCAKQLLGLAAWHEDQAKKQFKEEQNYNTPFNDNEIVALLEGWKQANSKAKNEMRWYAPDGDNWLNPPLASDNKSSLTQCRLRAYKGLISAGYNHKASLAAAFQITHVTT